MFLDSMKNSIFSVSGNLLTYCIENVVIADCKMTMARILKIICSKHSWTNLELNSTLSLRIGPKEMGKSSAEIKIERNF
jgi:hypothetical protein